MRKFYLILLSLCTVCTVMAQNSMIGYRYWFNRDVAAIHNISVTPAVQADLDFEVDIAALPPGLNVLHLQMLDTSGEYSSAVSGMFYKRAANNAMITGYRYWFNQAVADAVDVEISPTHQVDLSAALNAETLNEGLNVLHLGFYDDSKHLSAPQSYFFYKTKTGTVAQPKINAYEYWFDNDTSKSVFQEVTPGFDVMLTAEIETDSLIQGLHRFNIRFQDENNNWSQLATSFFYKPTTVKSDNQFIAEYEYWFNEDRENLTSVVLDTPVDPLELMLTFDMEPYPVGDYTFNFRSKDAFGMWSVVSTDSFYRAEIPLMWAEQTMFCDSAVVHFFNNTDSLQFDYLWDFGDGASTSEFAPVHEYPNPGYYTVSLTATDKVSMKDTTEHIIISVGSTFMEITKTNVEVGDSLAWRGQFYKEAGNYHEHLISSLGCDSIYVLDLIVTDSLISAPKDIILTPNTIKENESPGTWIGDFTAIDIDEDDSHVFSLYEGDAQAHNQYFSIENGKLYSKVTFDHEKQAAYVIAVEVVDMQNYHYMRFIEVYVTDVNEAPDSIMLSAKTIVENVPVGTTIGVLHTRDQDADEQFIYRLVAGEGDADNALFSIDGNKLVSKVVFDYELKNELHTRIEVEDKGGLKYSQHFVIQVIDQNDNPTAITLSNHQIFENQPIGSLIGQFTTTDQDADESFTYTFTSGENDIDNGSFIISGDSLLTGEMFDFEKKNTYFIRIKVTDNMGGSFSRSFTIVILDIDETPVPITDIRLTNHSVDENNEILIFVGKLSTVGGIGPTFKYSFVTGDGDYDNSLFKISNDSLYALASFDFESRSLYFTRVQTMDEENATYSKLMLLLVNDINENPYAMYISNTTVDEKLPAMTFVSKIVTFDEDRMDYHTYSLVEGEGDADNAYFTIRNDSLLTNEVLIYEDKQAFTIRIQTTDKGGKTYSMKVTVNLNNTSGIDLISDSRYNAYFSNDVLMVKSPETSNGLRIEMYNITGQLVLKESLDGNESHFRINGVTKGIYILNFVEDNQVVQQRRVLKY
jgi:PKD repeat protein